MESTLSKRCILDSRRGGERPRGIMSWSRRIFSQGEMNLSDGGGGGEKKKGGYWGGAPSEQESKEFTGNFEKGKGNHPYLPRVRNREKQKPLVNSVQERGKGCSRAHRGKKADALRAPVR